MTRVQYAVNGLALLAIAVRTDIEAWLAADMPTQLGALAIAHLEHPAVTAVVVTRGPRLDGKALYTITPKGDTNA